LVSVAVNDELTIAVSKGRIMRETLPLLRQIGIEAREDPERSRKLVLDTGQAGVKLIVLRAQDVPTFVDYGAADLGVAGKDVLLEYEGDGLYEPLDLGIARCRLVVAGRRDMRQVCGRMRVATKYVLTTRRHFAARGYQVEVIKLYGSMELAPLVGLADRIVDLVDTGATLRANGLVAVETIAEISSRLIVNRASMKMKHQRLQTLIKALATALRAGS
jgi:ATP phosphoribosyltransferase